MIFVWLVLLSISFIILVMFGIEPDIGKDKFMVVLAVFVLAILTLFGYKECND